MVARTLLQHYAREVSMLMKNLRLGEKTTIFCCLNIQLLCPREIFQRRLWQQPLGMRRVVLYLE